MNPFTRTELLITESNMKMLSELRVAVYGIGGVGSFVVEGLVRSGIGNLILIDGDVICESNLNRQIFTDITNIGRPKVEVMRERILKINPHANVTVLHKFITRDDMYIEKECDYIVDAIDTVTSKLLLIEHAKRLNLNIISSMGMGNRIDASLVQISDVYATKNCPLAKVMRHELRKRGISKLTVCHSIEQPLIKSTNGIIGSIIHVPATAGLLISNYIIREVIR